MTGELERLLTWLRKPGTVVFLSGEAGTGKSYRIGEVIRHWPNGAEGYSLPKVAVAAPTGLAAERIGGETIHHLLRIPVRRFELSYSEDGLLRTDAGEIGEERERDYAGFLSRIQALELLIIDEISMVRCDLMEVIEARLRWLRESRKPFGGLSLLLVGDLHQLPPVSDRMERDYLRETGHESPYFFEARCFTQNRVPIRYMELREVRRVKRAKGSQELKSLLHDIREGKWSDGTRDILERRYELTREAFTPGADDKFICTHRVRAAIINEWMLHYMPGPFVRLAPIAEGDGAGYVHELPTLLLKVGAPVMFTESDMYSTKEGRRRFYKGTFGVISRIMSDHLVISIREADGGLREEKILPERWRKSPGDGELRRLNPKDYKGARNFVSQYPVELAWAITIHKAQGCSLDNVFVDTQELFEPGQLYVALSRATRLAGLHMLSPARNPIIGVHEAVRRFEERMRASAQSPDPDWDEAANTSEKP